MVVVVVVEVVRVKVVGEAVKLRLLTTKRGNCEVVVHVHCHERVLLLLA